MHSYLRGTESCLAFPLISKSTDRLHDQSQVPSQFNPTIVSMWLLVPLCLDYPNNLMPLLKMAVQTNDTFQDSNWRVLLDVIYQVYQEFNLHPQSSLRHSNYEQTSTIVVSLLNHLARFIISNFNFFSM